MKKVIDFLEKNVQWIAVGIGGLILLVMLAQNLPGLSQPVKAPLPGRDVGPAEIDPAIEQEVAGPLEEIMKNQGFIPTFRVPPYKATFVDNLKAPDLAKLPNWLFENNRALLEGDFGPIDPNAQLAVAKTPKLPPVIMGSSHSVQTYIKEVLAPAPEQPEEDGAQPPAQPLPEGPDAVVPPPAVIQNPIAPARDATVVRVHYKLNMDGIHREFLLAEIPAGIQKTMALKVELVRERSLPNGEWGEQTEIGPLDMNKPKVAFPDNPAKPNALDPVNEYLTWAGANQVAILQPGFPDFEGDDPLELADDADASQGLNPDLFNPANFRGDLNKLPPDLRRKVLEFRRQKAKEQAEQRRRSDGGRGRNSPPPGPQSNSDWPPIQPPRESPIPSPAPPQATGNIFFQVTPAEPMPPMVSPDGVLVDPNAVANPSAKRVSAEPPPSAPFRPAADSNDIDCWAFDDTAKPGETYRYRVRYYLLNPLFMTNNIAEIPEDVYKIWICNEDDNWSNAITTPPLTHIYLAAAPPSNFASAKFVIFHWQNGKRHRFTGTFKPGDSISGSQAGINFVSSWTLADIRASAGLNPVNLVTLVAPGGTIEVRDFDTDQADPLYKKLEAEVNAAAQAPPTASSR